MDILQKIILSVVILGLVLVLVYRKELYVRKETKETEEKISLKRGDVLKDTIIPNLRIVKEDERPIINGVRMIEESLDVMKCDSKVDISCKMYNHRDINSKCTTLCSLKGELMKFNGNHRVEDGVHTCECKEIPIVEMFSDVDTSNIKLEGVKTDERFNDRDILEKHEQKRLQNLIFGQ
jgi:hypothetical protein